MKKYDLLCSGDSIIRVLEIQDDRILVIDCIKHNMPVWIDSELLESYSECTIDELSKSTGFTSVDIDTLDADQRKVMYERYTMITPILPFIADDKMRSKLICSIAEEHQVSKQTIRNYLCMYLSYLDVTVLAPKKRKEDRELTQDEKHIGNIVAKGMSAIVEYQQVCVRQIVDYVSEMLSHISVPAFSEEDIGNIRVAMSTWGEYGWTLPHMQGLISFWQYLRIRKRQIKLEIVIVRKSRWKNCLLRQEKLVVLD